MWLEEVEELFKGYLPYYVLIFLPIFIIMSPTNPVSASHEFPVFRMQQYELHGIAHGCKSAAINLEARSILSWNSNRHCVVVKVQDLTVDHFRNIKSKGGALLIIIPLDLRTLSDVEQDRLKFLESTMLAQEISIPVYFVRETPQLNDILVEISSNIAANDLSKSAAEAMVSAVSANGYQIVVSSSNPTIRSDVKIATIQGHLIANGGVERKTPTIVVVAHYDSLAVSPALSYGADSNGSGVVMLFELIRLFSGLYEDPNTQGTYNILFLLTGGGKINYFGSKKWLEDQLDASEVSIIQDASYVMCLDSLGKNDSIYMHVSKPPKEGSPIFNIFQNLKLASDRFRTNTSVEGVHKKINLADEMLAWEHERYSIRRLPAFTLSSVKNHKDFSRNSILDIRESMDLDVLERNTKVVAEALASQIYNVSVAEIFGDSWSIKSSHLEGWLNFIGKQPRSPQTLGTKNNYLVNIFKENFENYLRDVKVTYGTPDKRDPEYVFYDITRATVNIYSVKPAVFDLVLTFVIVLYLGAVYLFIQKFPAVYDVACSLTSQKKTK